ncbi:DUF3179 domain-containing protein [bacterium]|nr:DUF3179 domain-containing protein [bacterium]
MLLVQQARKDSPGTTSDPASFGYDLSSFTLPREALAVRRAPGVFKPQRYHELLTAAQIAEKNAREHGKTLVGSDRVIGVEINGEARAYPLRFLNWHEVCNDSLGGEQIAVTYSGLSDSATVFLLRGLAPAAGVDTAWPAGLKDSGLVHNSIALLSEEWLPAAQANLWRQLDGMAIAGPRQGERLERLPLALCEWSDWAAAHPGSTVAGPDPAAHEQYKSNPYGAYFQTQRLDFPVLPEPAKFRGQHGEWRKSRCLILRWKGEDYWCPFGLLIGSEVQDGVNRMKLSAAGQQFSFAWRPAEEGFSQESAWMEPAALPEAGLSCLGCGLYFACEASLGKEKMLPDSFMREFSGR